MLDAAERNGEAWVLDAVVSKELEPEEEPEPEEELQQAQVDDGTGQSAVQDPSQARQISPSPDPPSTRRRQKRINSAPTSDVFLRMASDLTHHSTCLTTYTNTQAFAFMLHYVPEMRRFFSVPYQLARALILRFPEHYPPDQTDVGQLASRLLEQKHRFQGPPEAEAMIRALWYNFRPM